MVEKSELLRVPVFADLPDDQIEWFISQSAGAGAQGGRITYMHQGDPADAMFVVLEGQLQARGEVRRRSGILHSKAGDIDRRAALFPHEELHGKRRAHDGQSPSALPRALIPRA